jgi:predicted GNAT family acetyltransferase
VNPALNGNGVGKQLVMAAVHYAREKQLKIMPLCPFAKSVFDKTPEIRDVEF